MKTIDFSVVIPVYNKRKYIRRAVESVLAQTHDNYELILVDDGSTDNSLDVISDIKDARIRQIWQTNAGVSAARNTGIRVARSDMIAFLDADDTWEPRFLASISRLIRRYPMAGLYATNYFIQRPGSARRPARIRGLPMFRHSFQSKDYFRIATSGQLPVSASSVCVPRQHLEKVGMFPLGEKMGEDQHVWWRIAIDQPLAFTNQCLATYHQDAATRACPNNIPAKELPFSRELHKVVANPGSADMWTRIHAFRYMGAHLLHLAGENIQAGQFDKARHLVSDWRTRLLPLKRLRRLVQLQTA